jgi:hypothetical protein
MKRREKIFWLIVGALFLVGFIALIPAHGEICKEAEKAQQESCTTYSLVPFLVIKLGKILDALGVAITALATIAIAWFTLSLRRSTDKLWEAGERQIALARESADIARDSLVSTQRAYVRVANFPWLWRGDTDRPGKFFYDITPIVENGGNTQTVDAKINVNSTLRDEVLPEDFDFPFVAESGSTLIGARQSVGASNAIILDDDMLSVQSGEKFFYIWGNIIYRDVFPNTPEHVTEFCTEISRVIGNPLDPREPGNPKGTTLEITFRIYPKHQKTD